MLVYSLFFKFLIRTKTQNSEDRLKKQTV